MNPFLLKKPTLTVCVAMMVYYAIMEVYYIEFICPTYGYYEFVLDIDFWKYVETKFLFLFVLIVSLYVARVSEFMYAMYMFFVVFFLVPALVTYSHSNQIAAPLYSIVILLIALAVVSPIRISIPRVKSHRFSNTIVILIILISVAPIIIRFGLYLNVQNLLLMDVYTTRTVFNENTAVWINYLFPWLVKAALPLFLTYFLIKENRPYALICMAILLYLYLISGEKIVFISSFVVLFFYFSGDSYIQKVKYFSYALILGLLAFPLIDSVVFNNYNLQGTFVMRMFFFPAHLNYYYFIFFDGNPLYFAESNIGGLFNTYPFDRPIGYIIAETYFHTSEMNVNNGLISDGFMNWGYFGIGLNIIMVSVIYLFFNSLDLDPRYLGIFFVMVFLFLSAPMLSMFLTSGLWIIFLMALTVMRREPPETAS